MLDEDDNYDLALTTLALSFAYGSNPFNYDQDQDLDVEWQEPSYRQDELNKTQDELWQKIRAEKSKEDTLLQMT